MPVFFFDCFDGCRLHADAFGMELASEDEMVDQAGALALALMGQAGPGATPRTVSVEVRDAVGRLIYAARVDTAERWMDPRAA